MTDNVKMLRNTRAAVVRAAAYTAVQQMINNAGRDLAAIDLPHPADGAMGLIRLELDQTLSRAQVLAHALVQDAEKEATR